MRRELGNLRIRRSFPAADTRFCPVLRPFDEVGFRPKFRFGQRPADRTNILFPISRKTCGVERDGAAFLEFDLGAARTFWIAETETEEEEKRREASDFLRYKNFAGKYADFHSLRHTFITNLGRAKVSPKAAQTLARHSDISLTMNIYSHISEEEQIAAINSLPGIAGLKKTDDR